MATTVMGSAYSPPSPTCHSSDTASPIYPDRPIRPLPKRPLRSRLSPEIANSILYPPAPRISKPLFYHPYNDSGYYQNGETASVEVTEIDKALIEAQKTCMGDSKHGYQFKGNEIDSEDEDGLGIIRRYEGQRQALETPTRPFANGQPRVEGTIAQSTASSNDSVDGYDSFENTNNKKKRKIPTSGSLGNHHSSLSAEMASMGISLAQEADIALGNSDNGVGQYYGTGSSAIPVTMSGTGISGAGRGRYGRSSARTVTTTARSPLGISTNGSNAWQAGRAGTQRRDYTPTATLRGKDLAYEQPSDHGIISAAIANAAALPTTPSKGQENISLLEQQATKKSAPAKTQFTFTCESDSAKGMVWPGEKTTSENPYTGAPPNGTNSQSFQGQKGFSTQGTQTSPTMASQVNQNGAPPQSQAAQQGKKPKRPPGKRYAMAARERRMQQEYNNYHLPPREEDVWICEFCEYESIFGSPPEALVRQYEIKDRRERKRLAEKRRLLEKAKMKGRKGKKGNKNAAKNANAATQPKNSSAQQHYAHQPADQAPVQSHGTQSDDYLVDDYDDDPIPMPAPLPQAPTKIPQPVAHHRTQSLRASHVNGTVNGGDSGAGRAS